MYLHNMYVLYKPRNRVETRFVRKLIRQTHHRVSEHIARGSFARINVIVYTINTRKTTTIVTLLLLWFVKLGGETTYVFFFEEISKAETSCPS